MTLDEKVLENCRNDTELAALLEEELEQLKRDRDALRHVFAYRDGVSQKSVYIATQLPVNLDRLVWAAQRQFDCGPRLRSAILDPRDALKGVATLCSAIRKAKTPSAVGSESAVKTEATPATSMSSCVHEV